MEILGSALKRDSISEADIEHAIRNAIKYIDREHHSGERQTLIIGPAVDGRPLEIIGVPSLNPTRIIHANDLRRNWYYLLKG